MQFTFDKFNRYEIPRAFLCNPNFVELYPITPVAGPKLSMRFNDISEMEFDIYEHDEKGNAVPCYSMLQKNMIVMLDGFGYWVITTVGEHSDGTTNKKSVKCMSYEYTLCQREANIDAGTYSLYNPIPTAAEETLLYKIIKGIPSWTIGDIDVDLVGKYRTFDMPDGDSIYSFLTVDVAEAYECIFSFDSTIINGRVVHRINAKPVPEALTDTEIVLRWNNLLKEVDIEETDSKIVTQLSVYGSGSLSVANINPLGTPRIYCFDPFAYDGTDQWMSEALWTRVSEWQDEVDAQLEAAVQGGSPTYKDYVSLVNTANYNLLFATSKQNKAQGMYVDSAQNILDAETPYSLVNNASASTALDNIYNWVDDSQIAYLKTLFETSTAYPLISLGVNGEEVKPAAIANYAAAITNNSDKIICQALANKYAAERIVEIYKADASAQEAAISSYKASMAEIASNLSFETYFTDELRVELDKYLFGDTYTNEHFVALSMDAYMDSVAQSIDADAPYYEDEDESEYGCVHYYDYVQSITQGLYDEAKNVLKRISEHTYTFKLSAINFLFLSEYEKYINDFTLGCQIHAEIREDDWVTPIILQVDFDYSSPDDFSLTFGNRFRLQTAEYLYNDLKDQMSKTSGTLTANFNDLIKPQREGLYDEMQEFIKGALDAAKNNVMAGTNQEFLIDAHGLLGRRYEDNAYTNEQIKVLNNGIFLTKDGWKNCATAIGKLTFGGSNYYGVATELLVGNIVAGNNLLISNAGGTFSVDGNGASLVNAAFTSYSGNTEATSKSKVVIDPSSNYAIAIYGRNGTGATPWGTPKFYADNNGVVRLDGMVEAIAGWVNSENDLTGKVGTSSGYYARIGSTEAPSQNGLAFAAGSFNGNTYVPQFSVNYAGKLVATGAEIGGLLKIKGDAAEGTNNIYIQGGKIGFSQLHDTQFADSWGAIKCDGLDSQGSAYIDIFGYSIAGIRLGCGPREGPVHYSVLAQRDAVHLYSTVYLDNL